MRNTTTTVVIAAGVVLTAVIVSRTPAQQAEVGQGACCYPSGGCLEVGAASCISTGGTFQGSGTTCATTDCTPQPTVVGTSVTPSVKTASGFSDRHYRVWRVWSDGQVDQTYFAFEDGLGAQTCQLVDTCGPTVLIPGTCPTDINRDGDTGIQDFLTLLGGWGACQ